MRMLCRLHLWHSLLSQEDSTDIGILTLPSSLLTCTGEDVRVPDILHLSVWRTLSTA